MVALARTVDTAERRARLARRHRLHPALRATSPVEVARDLAAVHSSDPASVYLAFRARVLNADPASIERALYDDRAVVRMLGMRRTLFVVPRDLVPVVQAAASNAIAARERVRLLGLLAAAELPGAHDAWLREVEDETEQAVAAGGGVFAVDLSRNGDRLGQRIVLARGRTYEAEVSVVTRVLLLLGMQGRVIRGRPRGTWISSQYCWSTPAAWLGGPIPDMPRDDAQRALVERWLRAFGPGTLKDIQWWTGWTVAETKRALAATGAVEVDLAGSVGFLLADDVEPETDPGPWIALLPALDSTPMGWTERDWYLGPHRAALFDTNGNVGPTVWSDGRVVGGWAQRGDGEIAFRLLEDVGSDAAAAIGAEAERVRAWIGDLRFTPRFRTPLERELRG